MRLGFSQLVQLVLKNCFPVVCRRAPRYKFNMALVNNCLSVTPAHRLCRQLGMKSYSTWFYNWSGFCVLVKKTGWLWSCIIVNPFSANPTKWYNTIKQFVGNLPTNCLSVFDHFVKLALKGLNINRITYFT